MSMFFLLLCTFLFIYLVLLTIFSAFLPLFLFIYVRNRLHIDDYLSKKYSYLKTQKQDGYISSSLFLFKKVKKTEYRKTNTLFHLSVLLLFFQHLRSSADQFCFYKTCMFQNLIPAFFHRPNTHLE